ncbi:MAG TPA: DNA mismatch repair protein MutT [Cytophagales bacterium]|jgi:8-oxo-dGTP diphosphatase|nr:DNA mismatch repair protein MutT [Cytophagales bacterium]
MTTQSKVNNIFYKEGQKLLVAVDCIVFGFNRGKLKLLIMERKIEPQKGKWSLIGGFVQKDESLDQAAYRILQACTGIHDMHLDQLYAFGEVDRDTGGRVVSVAYYSLINLELFEQELLKEYNAKWINIDDIPELALDHNKMANSALEALQKQASIKPIGFELLPEKFTLPQLQLLYEAIYNRKMDKRNFQKKILKNDLLIKLDEKDKSTSKKGAYLYRFDLDKYSKIKSNEDSFYIKV